MNDSHCRLSFGLFSSCAVHLLLLWWSSSCGVIMQLIPEKEHFSDALIVKLMVWPPSPATALKERMTPQVETPAVIAAVPDQIPHDAPVEAPTSSQALESATQVLSQGGVFSRRMRRAQEDRSAGSVQMTPSERQDRSLAQQFLLGLRHPSPDVSNEAWCELSPPVAKCANNQSLPASLTAEWLGWLQKGLAPQQMLVNKAFLEDGSAASQIRRQQPL